MSPRSTTLGQTSNSAAAPDAVPFAATFPRVSLLSLSCRVKHGAGERRNVGRTGFRVRVPRLYDSRMSEFTVEIERETDGRWIGEVTTLPGVLAYGASRDEAVAKAKALAFRVLAERLEHGEDIPEIQGVFAVHE